MIITESVNYRNALYRLMDVLDNTVLDRLRSKRIMLTGASGMIGSMLVDFLMLCNKEKRCSCYIEAVVRNKAFAEERFNEYIMNGDLSVMVHDVNCEFPEDTVVPDYIIHAASNTHPVAYAEEPVNTILANIYGTHNLLKLAAKNKNCRLVFLSSVEIYGENRGDTPSFDEAYCGYINCNTLRAGYPESKRVGEALCQAYIKQEGTDAVIVRIPRSYGPTMKFSDSKASAQFIKKCLNNEDIVLKSQGNQLFSYACAADDVTGILFAMTKGLCGEAYNLADKSSDVRLKEFAQIVAEIAGKKVIFEEASAAEKQGASSVTVSVMNGDKLKSIGWKPIYDIKSGTELTISVLKELRQN